MLPVLRFLFLVRPRNLRSNLREHGWRITALWFVGLLFFTLVFGSLVEFSFMIPFALDAEFVAGVLSLTVYYARHHALADLTLWSRLALARPGRWVRRVARRTGLLAQRARAQVTPTSPSDDPHPKALAFA